MTSRTEDLAARLPVPASRYVLFGLIATIGLGVDLLSKRWIFDKLWPPQGDHRDVLWIWPDHAGLEVSLNEGALFGIGQGMVWLFVVFSVAAIVGIFYWLFIAGEAHDLWLTIALAGIMAGIFGNLYDRLGLHNLTWPANTANHAVGTPIYAVRDWILLQWNHDVRWPNFNIADSLLVCGAIMLFVHAFLPERSSGSAGKTEPR